MHVFQTCGVPPSLGRINLPINGWTRNSRKAETNSVIAKSGRAKGHLQCEPLALGEASIYSSRSARGHRLLRRAEVFRRQNVILGIGRGKSRCESQNCRCWRKVKRFNRRPASSRSGDRQRNSSGNRWQRGEMNHGVIRYNHLTSLHLRNKPDSGCFICFPKISSIPRVKNDACLWSNRHRCTLATWWQVSQEFIPVYSVA